MSATNLKRFLDAQSSTYEKAKAELARGRKESHWIWYVFPQMKGLGHSTTSVLYSIQNFEEAINYLQHPVLGKRLVEISEVLLEHDGKSAFQIFGSPDDKKLKSSMTLFSLVPHANPVFKEVLQKFFNGERDGLTLDLLEKTT